MDGMIWLGILVAMLIIEIVTLGLTTIWFAGGALLAFIVSLLGAGRLIQVVVFLVTSLLLLLITRPIAVKYFNKDREKTNIDSLIGVSGIVTADINNLQGMGSVQLQGLEWTARSVDDTIIPKGQEVQVESIQGVKLMVREIKNEERNYY